MIADGVLDFSIEDLQEFVSKRDDNAAVKSRWIFEKVPRWFIAAMRKLQPDSFWWDAELPGGGGEAAVMVFQELHFCDSSWFDHPGWVGDALVSEPYRLTPQGVSALVNFCEQTGTMFTITGASHHFPTATLRIAIRPIKPTK
jgi:hypothetical protein